MFTSLISVLAALLSAEPAAEGMACQPHQHDDPAVTTDLDLPEALPESLDFAIDPRAFFDQLVLRYRGLAVYRDVTRVIQITQFADDSEPQRVETEVESSIEDDSVSIRTPGAQLRRGLGIAIPIRVTENMDSARESYELWLLPHLTLKLADEPLKEFREGVPEGFTATEAVSVTMDDRQMVHLELKSGDGLSEDSQARFDLYVDPDSMLIERIEGEQRLPDGGHYETTLEIKPSHVEARQPETHKETVKSANDLEPVYPDIGPTTFANEGETATSSAWPESPPADQPAARGSTTEKEADPPGQCDGNHADVPVSEQEDTPRPNAPRGKGKDASCEQNDDERQSEPHDPRRSCSDRLSG